jgi:thiamine biosynthesis lipoprotein
MTSNSLFTCALLALLVVSARGIESPDKSLSLFEAVEPHMGTLMRIKIYASNEDAAKQALRAAFDRIARLDDDLSDYKPESELNRITTTAVHHPVPISPDLFRILAASQELSQSSDGAFDITLGPVTHLWREARKDKHLPDAAALHNALARCGYRKLHLDFARHTAQFDEPGMQLDAGGIAKGYAADEALAVLERLGIHSALVAASGDLAFSDAPPGEKGWKLGVDSIDEDNAPFTRVLVLANAAMSTSGDMEQHLDANGIRYSHIVNPDTGVALTHHITVTIVARHGIEADGVTKVVSILGETRGLAYVNKRPGLASLIVTSEGSRSHISESNLFASLTAVPALATLNK